MTFKTKLLTKAEDDFYHNVNIFVNFLIFNLQYNFKLSFALYF